MSVTENIDRIEQGKTTIISSIKSKGVNVPNGVLINEIAPYINEIQSGSGGDTPDTPKTELEQKYEGATVIRVNIPTDNYEFAINLCNNATTATYNVDWGDNILENSLTTDEQHHIYAKAGIYDINIYNLSENITLGGYSYIDEKYIPFLFNNFNNDIWNFRYIEIKDKLIVSDVLIGNKITYVGSYAFYGCTSLQSVVILEGVTKIGDYAFYGCTSLQSIELPEGVTAISTYAFYGCTSLQSIELPEGVTAIGFNTFYGCSSLRNITIPSSVTTIEGNAFQNCTSLQSIELPEGVTAIGGNAFNNCTSLQNITIPSSVTKIGDYTFYDCTSLQSIELPEGVTAIGGSAFNNCTSLQSVVIPEGVTKIGDYAFYGCTSLQSVVIPEGVTAIGGSAFNGCSSLQSVVIPEGVTKISDYAFYNCNFLQNITIPNSVTSIDDYAFKDCTYLQSITINAMTAPTIQNNTFSISSFKYTKRYLYVPKDANGYDEGNWKTILIDKGWELRYIEEHIKTPTTMKLKTVNNFLHKWGCIGDAKLVDYDLVDNEYIYHFDDKIEEIIPNTFYRYMLKEIELPEGVTTIPYNTFNNCTSLQNITIPNSVTSIGGSAFNNCTSLRNITIPNSVTTIGTYAFYNCTSLQSVVIPEGVTKISDSMFLNCSSLQSVVIPESVTKIESQSFVNCVKLTSITIPNSVTSIGKYVFRGCTSLQSIVIPEGVTILDAELFENCSSLTSITIPNSVTTIGQYTFKNCYSLQTITINAMTAPTIRYDSVNNIGTKVPNGTPKILRVPKDATGYDTGNWKTYLIDKGYTLEYIEPEEPEVADNEDILVVENVDEVEGTVFMRNPNNIAIQYSTNGSQFNDYTAESEISIGVGDKVYFKWSEVISNARNSTALVHSSVKYKVYGELKQGNNQYAYLSMFRSQSSLIDASELKLPATTLASSCYNSMFKDCTSLTTAPELPATTLASSCYSDMFNWCTSLTTAPELPATTLQSYCYFCMFYNCTSLTTAPELPATTLASNCYQGMFQGCTSLTTAPELPATTLASSCYNNMFRDCISLTTAPELPATTLASSCYYYMFYNCTNLNYVKHHIVDWNTSYTSYWLSRVAPSGTMYCPLNSTIPNDNVSGIPSGWIRVNIE